jgi:hypothetical protein
MSSRITVKQRLIIFHHSGDWMEIYSKILKDYGMGMAVRTRLRRELGFTYREHQHWVELKKWTEFSDIVNSRFM